MLARALVGVIQASASWSSIEPCTISTSGFSSKVPRHALTILGLMSTSTTFTAMGSSSRSGDRGRRPWFTPRTRRDTPAAAASRRRRRTRHRRTATAGRPWRARRGNCRSRPGCVQAVGDLGVVLHLPQRDPGDRQQAGLLPARGRVVHARAGGVAEVDPVPQPAGVGAVHPHAHDDLGQQDAARQDSDPVGIREPWNIIRWLPRCSVNCSHSSSRRTR